MQSGETAESEDLEGDLKTFLEQHVNQLQTSGVPSIFWQALFGKLKNEVSSISTDCWVIPLSLWRDKFNRENHQVVDGVCCYDKLMTS